MPSSGRAILFVVGLIVIGGPSAVIAPTPQGARTPTGVFVVRSGPDTLSVERVTRVDRVLSGSIETRVNGRTSRATYSLLRNDAGRVVRLEASLTVPQRGLSTAALDVVGDSLIGPVMYAERESFFRGVMQRGAVPLLTLVTPNAPEAGTPISIAMLEGIIHAAPRGAGTTDVPVTQWGNVNPSSQTRPVTWLDARTVTIGVLGGLRVTLDDSARIVSAVSIPGSGGTISVHYHADESLLQPSREASVNRPPQAIKPPMGWNSWNRFGCQIDEALIRQTADAMVSTGMLGAGYQYLNIDDCWEGRARDASGHLVVDSVRFPSGMKALTSYVHSKGLKVGIYSSGGTATCQRRPATLDHEVDDARLFASWEIDYVKYDNCNAQNRPEQQRFRVMYDAVQSSGRRMIFSVCEWGEARPWLWAPQMGAQLWRTTEDIRDSWMSVLAILDQQVGLDAYSAFGAYNDPDMLEVGNGKMTYDQYVAHFSLWALLNAPLIAGNDLRAMTDSTRGILMNRDVIEVDQDFFVRQGFRLRNDGALQVWAKPMSDRGWALVLLNRGSVPAAIDVSTRELEAALQQIMRGGGELRGGTVRMSGPAVVHDLWTKETFPLTPVIRRMVPASGAVMLRIGDK